MRRETAGCADLILHFKKYAVAPVFVDDFHSVALIFENVASF
ncbi:MAG: hypothetical protein ACI9GK_001320 [Devosia sp.]|jgi:hypothetical protein|tara:strand:- start:4241 stop:4366 length:126 start_codon:yes stop_codon:yes gene_type:complete